MHHIHDLLLSWGPLGLFVLALVESAGIPNPGGTDALLLVLTASAANPVLCAGLAVVGSLLGSLVFYEITSRGGEKLLARYTGSGRGARFRGWFQHYGLVTVFIAALLPIPVMPFKVFAACAGAMQVGRMRFIGVLAVARIPRYFALAYLGSVLGENSGVWIKGHLWHMGALAIALFIVLFGLIRWMDRSRPAEVS
jgi:membrane protein YqaA with SNARE-associated domain